MNNITRCKFNYVCYLEDSKFGEDIITSIPLQKGDEIFIKENNYEIIKIVYRYKDDEEDLYMFPTLIVSKL